MEKHPIESVMTTTLENIRDMVDVNTIIGEPVPTPDGSTVIPVSKVSFGFASGGGEYRGKGTMASGQPPFAGGSGAGVTLQPVGFLILGKGEAKLLPAQYATPLDHVLEAIPRMIEEIAERVKGKE